MIRLLLLLYLITMGYCNQNHSIDDDNFPRPEPEVYYRNCIHDDKIKENFFEKYATPTKVFKGKLPRENPVPLKIKFYYTDLVQRKDYFATFKTNLAKVAHELESTILVKHPAPQPLLVQPTCIQGFLTLNGQDLECTHGCHPQQTCGGNVIIPPEFLHGCRTSEGVPETDGPGVNGVQLIVIITAEAECNKDIIAYSSDCRHQLDSHRPVMGSITMCEDGMNPNAPEGTYKAVKHELIHILGFSIGSFAYFVDKHGKPYTNLSIGGEPLLGKNEELGIYKFSERVAKEFHVTRNSVKRKYEKTIWGLVTPKLLEAARNYFDCDKIEYVPLEDYSTSGSILNSHFDELHFEPELMSPVSVEGYGSMSLFTLAFLEDTGWYIVNYSRADPFYNYGKWGSCGFLKYGCYDWISQKAKVGESILPYCNLPNENSPSMRCYSNYKLLTSCPIIKHSKPVSDEHSYFTTMKGIPNEVVPYYYSISPTAENCPIYQIYNNEHYVGDCKNTFNYNNRKMQQVGGWDNYYGEDSTCANINSKFGKYESNAWFGIYGALCIKYKCNLNENAVKYYSRENNLLQTCTLRNRIVKFTYKHYRDIEIMCPDPADICPDLEHIVQYKKEKFVKPYKLARYLKKDMNLILLIIAISIFQVLF